MMKPFQQRVVEEKSQLDERLQRLMDFIGGDIFLSMKFPERERLCEQMGVMRHYSIILGERISEFT